MAQKSRPGVMTYFDMLPVYKKLDYESIGKLHLAAVLYAANGEEPDFEDDFALELAWAFIKPRIDDDAKRYDEVVDGRKAAAEARWSKSKTPDANDANASEECKCNAKHANASVAMQTVQTMPTTTTTANTTTTTTTTTNTTVEGAKAPNARASTRFTPPTPEEVTVYAKEHGYQVDGQRFCDFYASKGWKVGTTPMKDWKAAVRNWATRDKAPSTAPPAQRGPKVVREQVYTQRAYEDDEGLPDWMVAKLKESMST